MSRRQCTHQLKIVPIRRKTRELMADRAIKPTPGAVECLLGISLDEVQRMKPSDAKYIRNVWPLIDRRWSRTDCRAYLERLGIAAPRSACIGCLSAETMVLTRDGARPIQQIVGGADLLVPSRRTGKARWRRAHVRSFGVQRLWRIDLRRGRSVKTIYATAEHRWVRREAGCWAEFVTTTDLRPGDVLPIARAQSVLSGANPPAPSPWAIAQGFTFGDGSRVNGRGPASVNFYGEKDRELRLYFPFGEAVERRDSRGGDPYWHIADLPRAWKDRPQLREHRGFLLGWLAGYFAADGSVTANAQAVLSSAVRENLAYVRDVCAVLGVGTSPVRSATHPAKGGAAMLHHVGIDPRGLPEGFWLIGEHRARVGEALSRRRERGAGWCVHAVEATDRVEEVFCAVVPGDEMFVLLDDVVTGNCPYHSDAEWRDLRDRAPDEFADAVTFERELQQVGAALRGTPYLHRQRIPLDEVDLSTPEDRGQLNFDAECEGMCGV
jgi:hypothetical protein